MQKISLLAQPYQELTCGIGLKSPFEVEIKNFFLLIANFRESALSINRNFEKYLHF